MPLSTTGAARRPPGWLHRIGLFLLCSAYLQGAIDKLIDFSGALAEMRHFGLLPAPVFAVGTIAFELLAVAMVLGGMLRWLGALGLAGFTVAATFIANRFWEVAPPDRLMLTNAFFEHWGLAGAFLLVAWHDLKARHEQ